MSGPLAQAQDLPTIRATTKLVNVNVVVTDHDGNPIRDLTREDFQVLDNRRKQEIRFFSTATTANAPKSAPLPPDVISNDWERQASQEAITVVLLDMVNTEFADLAYARQQVIKFLLQIRPEDHVGVYVLGHDLRILNEFTNDSEVLIRKISTYGLPSIDLRPLVGNPIIWTCTALEGIAHHLAGQPRRKNMIWVSSAFPLLINTQSIAAMENFAPQLRRAALALNEADVAVYPVNARGLVAEVPDKDSVFLQSPQSVSNIRTMQVLARETGGKAYVNWNDIRGAIRQVVDGSRVTYSLGFYPSSVRGDNKFHELSIKVNRHGAAVHCRQGYFDRAADNGPENSIRAVLSNSLEATGVGIMARARRVKDSRLDVQVQVEPDGIITAGEKGNRVVSLDFALAPMDDAGSTYPGVLEPFTVRLDPAAYQALLHAGVRYRRTIDFHQKATMLRIVVRDRQSGAIGSVTIPADKFQKD